MLSIQVIRFPLLVLTLKMCDCGLQPCDSKEFCFYVTFLLYRKSGACLCFVNAFQGDSAESAFQQCYIVFQYNSAPMGNTMQSSQKLAPDLRSAFRAFHGLRIDALRRKFQSCYIRFALNYPQSRITMQFSSRKTNNFTI